MKPSSLARTCPHCGDNWTSSKMALKCWYGHSPEELAEKPVRDIADELGISVHTVRRTWAYLVDEYQAKPRGGGRTDEPGRSYDAVVDHLRGCRARRRAPKRGWTVLLGKQLGVSRQRVCQLREKAIARGDL